MPRKSWSEAVQDGLVTGAVVCAATSVVAALLSRRAGAGAARPINASTHVAYGRQAERVDDVDLKHTALGFVINAGASVFWATIYEKMFGATAERGDIAQAVFGAKAIADLAYLTDYHVMPKRLTPGWEAGVSDRSLLMIFNVLAASLPVRGLLKSRLDGRRFD